MLSRFVDYIPLLSKYVSFATVSLPGYDSAEPNNKCINFLKNLLEKGGVKVDVWENFGAGINLNPVIFGSYIKDEKLPTILVYGHYDVVAANEDEWEMTDPFKLYQRNGTLWGRGATDNKGQNLLLILSVLSLIKDGRLAYNVKFFIEGNEETGGEGIDKVIKMHKEELQADYIIVSDGEMVGHTPVIELSLRGIVNIKVTVTTAVKDLHSGLTGGAVYNSTIEAAKLISSLYDKHNRVEVKDFYSENMAKRLAHSEDVIENNKAILTRVDLKSLFGVKDLKVGRFDAITRIGLMPTIEVTGITAGSAEKGFKNIIPHQTIFGLNCRIVGDQDPDVVAKNVIHYLENQTPEHVDLKTEVFASHRPIMLSIDPKVKDHLSNLLTEAYGEKPLDKYTGGGVPVVGHFQDILGVDALLIPLANDTCNMHGPDENIDLWHVESAFAFAEMFFSTPINK